VQRQPGLNQRHPEENLQGYGRVQIEDHRQGKQVDRLRPAWVSVEWKSTVCATQVCL
jgi:hypothetical protein